MEPTTEHIAEIISIVRQAQGINHYIGNYKEHYRTIDGGNGYYVFLDNSTRIFIHKSVVEDYPKITPNSIDRIAKSLVKL